MEPDGDSRGVGRHLLGPHVVGQRVVVRRVLRGQRGPTGGPAMTDVLGTCLAWSDSTCVVAPERGEPVRIAVADIVSGKPVPPRPSVRQRVSPAEAESHVASLWPHLETEPLGGPPGGWTLRFDPAPVGRVRRRANSCLAMGEVGLPYDEAAAAITRWYAARSRPPLAQVEVASPAEDALRGLGWEPLPDGDAHFQLASLARARRALTAPVADDAEVVEEPGGVLVSLAGGAASGRASYDRDWLGIHDLHVEVAQRRRGLARAVLAELLEWGAEQGATTAWLHVETGNAAGIGLYEGVGFRTHHTCRYLAGPRER